MKQKRRPLVAFLILLSTCFGQKLIHSYFLWLLSRAKDSPVFNSLFPSISPTHLYLQHIYQLSVCIFQLVCLRWCLAQNLILDKRVFRIFESQLNYYHASPNFAYSIFGLFHFVNHRPLSNHLYGCHKLRLANRRQLG